MKTNLSEALFYHKEKNYQKAIKIYNLVLKNQPNHTEANFLLGSLYLQIKNYENAEFFLKKSLETNNLNFAAYNNLGICFKEKKKFDNAITNFKKAIQINLNYAECYNNIGTTYREIGEFDLALKSYSSCLAIDKNFSQAYNNRGILKLAMYKFFEAEEDFEIALRLKPNYEDVYVNLGILEKTRGNNSKSIIYFNKAVSINKNFINAYINRAQVFEIIKKYHEALVDYQKAKFLDHHNGTAITGIINLKLICGIWSDLNKEISNAKNFIEKGKSLSPFYVISIFGDIKYEKKNIENGNSTSFIKKESNIKIHNSYNKKINLAYFSSDFREHVMGQLMIEILQHHDRNKFIINGFYLHNIKDKVTVNIEKDFDNFFYCNLKTDDEIKKIALENKIDIAVDLMGFTRHERASLFYKRVAPIQLSYLGYPGSVGIKNMDYIIGDKYVIPDEMYNFYREKVIELPLCYRPHYHHVQKIKKKFARYDFKLPENGFILCCFNANWKIRPEIFNCWLRILKRYSNTYLWILEDNEFFKKNILEYIKKNNIDYQRIIFRKRLPIEEHIFTFQLADLFLDSFPYGAHTTAVEAVMNGLPIVTLSGSTFASRVGMSLCNFLDEKDLIAENIKKYEMIIEHFINNINELEHLKKRILRKANIIFNTKNLIEKIEESYVTILKNSRDNKKPQNLKVI
ncbi:MAG: tetratricopeptide repeat protein [Pelagibacterales bacterium]|nr:tetratricopeptide repeat protein [Pelagibacterales bacterium]